MQPTTALSMAMPTATPLAVDAPTLARFAALMAAQGLRVQPARMLFDRIHAREQLARAHCSASEPLRRLALALFDRMQSDDEPRHGAPPH